MRRHLRNALITASVAALLLSGCASQSGDSDGDPGEGPEPTVDLKLASPVGPSGAPGQSLQWIADQVAERTDDTVNIEIFDTATLLPSVEGLAGVQDGRADMAFTYTGYQAADMPLFSVAEVPFLTRNGVAEAYAFTKLAKDNATFQSEFERLGIVPIAFLPVGNAAMGFREETTSLDQLDGLRVRVPGERVSSMVGILGAEGASVEFAEGYEALQRGVIDGWVGTEMASVANASWYEVTPFFVQGGLGTMSHSMVFMSQDAWDSLSESQREAILAVADDYLDWIDESLVDFEAESCDAILDGGGTVTTIPEDEVEDWQDEVGDLAVDEIRANAERVGVSADDFDDFLDAYEETVREFEDTVTYTDGLEACANR